MSETTANSNTKTETNIEKPARKASFVLKAGTRINLGADEITLSQDSRIYFDDAENEQKVVGMLLHSKNLELNRSQLKCGYNGFGGLTHSAEEMKEIRADEAAAEKAAAAAAKTK